MKTLLLRLELFLLRLIPQRKQRELEDGERLHTDGPDCWCSPTLFFDGGDEFGNVWIHKAPADELPPARILIEAVADAMKN